MELEHIKIVIIGSSGVGKTSILTRYIHDIYDGGIQHTIGVEYSQKIVENHKLEIWDLSGIERFRSIVRSYYNKCSVALLVFDLANVKSLYDLIEWIKDIRTVNTEKVVFILVGNKSDISNIDQERIDKFLKNYNLNEYIECSAKSGDNINKIFENVVKYFAVEKIQIEVDEPPKNCWLNLFNFDFLK